MKKKICLMTLFFLLSACASSRVLVKKDTCKDLFDGLIMECETVKK